MRWLLQLTAFVIFSHFMLCNRKHTTKITGELLIFSISSNTKNYFMWTKAWTCFMFSPFVSTELKTLQTFLAASFCPTKDVEHALRCLKTLGEKNNFVEKRGLVPAGSSSFLTVIETMIWCAQWIYRCYRDLPIQTSSLLWAYCCKRSVHWPLEDPYLWLYNMYFKEID